ncbi:hypothetical protein Msub_10225 [Marinobacter subterrani]|uniref:Uncharacterized protein n=2 Tax=Marinobacter subterrani TaxID=1658765 RepID=A0A0J7J7W9_9GAMM|nr:hypothetical protein Msub_10225 [Marinobacter subterrani]
MQSLEVGLEEYWPVVNPDKNGLQEANLTTHLAHKALNSGFYAYPQASNAHFEAGHSRVDLLLIRKTERIKTAVLVEAKKLYSSEKALELVSDFEKIRRFRFVPDRIQKGADLETVKYGLLMAITTSSANMEWWNDPYDWDFGASWDKLKAIIETAALRSSVTLPARRHQYVLYAVFELGRT